MRLTDQHIVERCAALQSWRPESEARYLIGVMRERGVPFCDECADWHQPDDLHSTTDFDKG